jgi:hypothetical protein
MTSARYMPTRQSVLGLAACACLCEKPIRLVHVLNVFDNVRETLGTLKPNWALAALPIEQLSGGYGKVIHA